MAENKGIALLDIVRCKFVTNETVPRTVWTDNISKLEISDEIDKGAELRRRNKDRVVANNAGLAGSADLFVGSNIKATCDTFISEWYAIGKNTVKETGKISVVANSAVHSISGTLYAYAYAQDDTGTKYLELVAYSVRFDDCPIPALDSDWSEWAFTMKSRFAPSDEDGYELNDLDDVPNPDDVVSA